MKKEGLILVLAGAVLSLGFAFDRFRLKPFEEEAPSVVSLEPSPTPESVPLCTRYTNGEYSFSLCYPLEWALPEEEAIIPPQQHLYQITLNPQSENYLIDIYDQPAPISLGSFVRDYFQGAETSVSWTNEVEIKGQEALQFFLPRTGAMPVGIGGIAFRKGPYVLTITTPEKRLSEGDFKQIVNEKTLTQLAESFEWAE